MTSRGRIWDVGNTKWTRATDRLLTEGDMKIKRSARIKTQKKKVNYLVYAGKRTYKRKCNKPKNAKMEYLKSLNPLEMEQPKLVVQMAAVEFQASMEEEVAKMVMV